MGLFAGSIDYDRGLQLYQTNGFANAENGAAAVEACLSRPALMRVLRKSWMLSLLVS